MTQLRQNSGSSGYSQSGSLIAVKNIYYLLLYAWDRFDESLMTAIDAEPESDLLNLLAAVLTRGVDQLLRRGLDRGYLLADDEIAGVRGKVAMSTTLKRDLLSRARVACQFDELSHDVLHNQIVKATFRALLYCQALDTRLRMAVRTAYLRLPGVSDISLSKRTFRDVQLHRNIHFYGFLIDVCRLLYDHLIPDEAKGTFRFRDFTRDEESMRLLFERFLYNFYKHEQAAFKVRRRRFSWAGAQGPAIGLLPEMLTDITLTRPGQCLVIDAKYTPNVVQEHFHGSSKLRSGHLYQLFAYLKNLPDGASATVDGMLLYPLAQRSIDAIFRLPGHRLRVRTIDLNRHWSLIRRDLLALL